MLSNAKEIITPKKSEHLKFPVADGTAKLCGRDYGVREPTVRRNQTVRSEDLKEDLQGNSESHNQQTKPRMTQQPAMTFGQMEGDFIYRHQVELRVQLYVPKEETFPIPLK